ncbi:hypothetical protein BCR34DRAFT_591652 [Clohesyomyces aquaticus]|uniref:GPI anchored protein n=1 Tax=Clohesyomyces aquaticus TaxID=1231657 RepID=A0A1Y1Z089_9PLEO|nr:hypothetical protein BCR34DRAFT_591652 [Clohesyomyces aquaticus]
MARAIQLLIVGLAATALAKSGDHESATTSAPASVPTTLTACGHGGPGRKRHGGPDECDSSSHHSEFETEIGNYYSYTFDPSNALSYGPSATGTAIQVSATTANAAASSSVAATLAPASSAKASGAASSSPSVTTRSGATSTLPSAFQVTGTGAANAHYPEIIGVVAGGLMAGLALA